MDTLINESVDDRRDSSARRAFTVTSHAPVVGDEALDSKGKLSKHVDDSNFALDDFHDSDSDKFSDTGYMNDQDMNPENAGVRGPQSESILYPHDCKKLLQVCRGIKVVQDMDASMNSFQAGSLREEANVIHEDILNVLVMNVADVFQLHRLLQVKCVKDWIGWREVKDILGKRCSNAFTGVIIEDFI